MGGMLFLRPDEQVNVDQESYASPEYMIVIGLVSLGYFHGYIPTLILYLTTSCCPVSKSRSMV